MTTLELKNMTTCVNLHWGNRMPLMAAEECGEFVQAVSKLERKLYAHLQSPIECVDELDHLAEEMGDVFIVIGALANRYGILATDIEEAITSKLSEERVE